MPPESFLADGGNCRIASERLLVHGGNCRILPEPFLAHSGSCRMADCGVCSSGRLVRQVRADARTRWRDIGAYEKKRPFGSDSGRAPAEAADSVSVCVRDCSGKPAAKAGRSEDLEQGVCLKCRWHFGRGPQWNGRPGGHALILPAQARLPAAQGCRAASSTIALQSRCG